MKINVSGICLCLLITLALSSCASPQPTALPEAAGGAQAGSDVIETSLPLITETPLPSPTPPPPSEIPMAKLYFIDIMEESQVPSDLVEILYFYSQGGAFGSDPKSSEKTAYWKTAYNSVVQPAVPGELGWLACGISETATPQAVLTLPDQSTLELGAEMVDGILDMSITPTCASVKYEVAPGAAFGQYSVQLDYGDGELHDSVTLELPTERIHADYQGRDWFAGFQPGETIHVIVSSDEDPFNRLTPSKIGAAGFYLVKQLTIQADQFGSFQIDIKSPPNFKGEFYLSARGEQSGAISRSPEGHLSNGKYEEWFKYVWPPVCSDSVRLKVGDTARVTEGQTLGEITDMPHLQKSVKSGTTVKLLRGPICTEAGAWAWLVSTPDQGNLLLYEGDEKEPLLELVNP